MSVHLVAFLAAFLLSLLSPQAQAAGQPSAEPMLRVEAGMHRRPVQRIDTDAQGRWLVSASDDKTARIWDVATGQLLQVLRPPIAEGSEGRLYAAALSRDGNQVAVAGTTGQAWEGTASVYVFDRASGRMIRRLKGLPDTVHHLAFSPDDRFLAIALGGRRGMRVWPLAADPSGMQPLLNDPAMVSDSYGATWSRDGRLAVSAWDGKVRLYKVSDKSLERLAEAPTPGSSRPESLAFSPDGNELAVGHFEAVRVDILDGKTLALRHAATGAGSAPRVGLASVAWTADGKTLVAGGTLTQGNGQHVLRRWPQAGRGSPVDTAASDDPVSCLTALPDGRVAVSTLDPVLGLFSPAAATGGWRPLVASPTADPRPVVGTRDLFRVASDGARVQFSFDHSDKNATYVFDLNKRSLSRSTDNSLLAARLQGLPVTGWEDSESPAFADQPLKLEPYEVVRSLSISPTNMGFVLGTSWWLRYFNAQGKPVWEQPVTAPAWGVNQSKTSKLLVVAHGDGVIRWHRMSDGQELLAFFAHADRQRWVLWTPSGYFDASPGGESLLGWHVNRGLTQAADFFPARSFRMRFHRPDIIDRVLQTLDESRADASLSGRGGSAPALLASLPPVLELVSSPDPAAAQPAVKFKVRARVLPDAPVTGWQVRVNGLLWPAPAVPAGTTEREFTVPLTAADNDIRVLAMNRHGASAALGLRMRGPTAPAAARDVAKLHLLAAGVGAYPKPGVAKPGAGAKDVQAIAAAWQRQKGKAFSEVTAQLLTDGQATREQILAGLAALARQVGPQDVAVVILSGHGINDPSLGYSFLPVDVEPDRLAETSLPLAQVVTALRGLPGRTLLVLDTVHSDNVLGSLRRGLPHYINGTVNQLVTPENGLVVLSATSGRQMSQLDGARTQGLFAAAMVEGLDGRAAAGDGRVTTDSLAQWVSERVKDTSRGQQAPVRQASEGVPAFTLGLKR